MVATYEHLIEHTPRNEPWAVLAGNYTFYPIDEDAQLLGRLAAVARHAGAPFLAAASSSVLGCSSFAETPEPRRWHPVPGDSWQALRRLPQASWLGLALPRFLLRLPYGKQTHATENFAFEEFGPAPHHEHYLWGNAALACAYLLGEAFLESGWNLRPGEIAEISGLPMHTYRADGESHLKPCAEALLSESAAEAILDQGLMPLLSIKGSDAVRLLRFQSLAEPARALSGRWS
jgi:type VI secretion system protein ImpC